MQPHDTCWEFLKSQSRTRESYLLLLKDLELFEGLSSTDCLCMSRIEPASMHPIFEVLSIWFFFEKIRVLLKFYSNFSPRHLSMAILSYGAFRLRNFRYCSWWVLDSLSLGIFGWTWVLLRVWWFVNFLITWE